MKKQISILSMLLLMMMAFPMMVACGSDGDGDGGSSGPVGWYMEGSTLVTGAEIQQEIASYCEQPDHEAFYDDGSYGLHHVWIPGYCDQFSPHLTMDINPYPESIIHIIDGQSLLYYSAYLYKQGSQVTKNYELLYQVDGGTYGKLGYYGNGTYFAYIRDGNNIIIQQGKEKAIFTITSGGLLENGGGKWTKYDPNKIY